MSYTLAVLEVLGIVLGSISCLTNLAQLYWLCHVELGSRLTGWILRSQVLVHACNSLIIVVVLLPGTDAATPYPGLNQLICHVWTSGALFYVIDTGCSYNLVCISIDRVLSVFAPVAYRQHPKRFAVGLVLPTVAMVITLNIPWLSMRSYDFTRQECFVMEISHDTVWQRYLYAQIYIWPLLAYTVPVFSMLVMHGLIVVRLVRGRTDGNELHWFVKTKPPLPGSHDGIDQRTPRAKMNRATRRLVLRLFTTSLSLAVCFAAFRLLDTLIYVDFMLTGVEIIDYEFSNLIGVLCTAVYYTVTPIVVLATSPTLRSDFSSRMIQLGERCRAGATAVDRFCPSCRVDPC